MTSSVFLVGAAVLLAGVTAAGIRPPTDAPEEIRRVSLSVRFDIIANAVEILHTGGATLDAAASKVVVATAGARLYEGPLGAKGAWAAGDRATFTLAGPTPLSTAIEIWIVDARTQAVLGGAALRVPSGTTAPLVPLAATLGIRLDNATTPRTLKPGSGFQLEAAIAHPAGRKFVRYAYADLSSFGGPSWALLADDGTGGDPIAGDGVFGGRFRLPVLAPVGVHVIPVRSVDLNGGRSDGQISLEVVRPPLVSILDASANRAAQTSGSGCMRISGSLAVNSTSPSSLYSSGSGCAGANGAGFVAQDGGSIATRGGGAPGCCSPAPVPGALVKDPYAGTLYPVYVGGIWYVDGVPQPVRSLPPAGNVLLPGVYPGGIKLSGGTWSMAPGVYIAEDDKFSASGSTVLTGSNVFVYIASKTGTGCKGLTISGSGTITLTPPTTGPYTGIVIAQERNCVASATLSGGSGLLVNGVVHLPKAPMTMSGGSTMTLLRAILVVRTLTVTGGGFTLVQP